MPASGQLNKKMGKTCSLISEIPASTQGAKKKTRGFCKNNKQMRLDRPYSVYHKFSSATVAQNQTKHP
jgi:hypothetical protein